MANSKKACKYCKEFIPAESGVKVPAGFFCSLDHALQFANEKVAKKRNADINKKKKVERKKHVQRKKEVRKRSEWYDILQSLVNQYILRVRDKHEPCCTCGTNKPSIKYDAGHYRSRGACQELRFELTNIHKQCSVQCNGFKSGARAEYNEFIKRKYGMSHYEFLNSKHKPLKEQFPHWSDIDKEILRYRKLLRDNGVEPRR